ncbi:MAG TPA: DUF1146 family protein [Bacilli bacterium]|nr:DUF1146 family protein [Bacilli bacterium]
MTIKAILYILTVPLIIYSMDGINYEKFIKANKVLQARIFFFVVAIALSYLTVNFFYDFFLNSQIVV